MDKYYTVKVKVSEESLKEYLSQYFGEEEIEEMNLDDECTEVINVILQDHFTDFFVIGKNSLFLQ